MPIHYCGNLFNLENTIFFIFFLFNFMYFIFQFLTKSSLFFPPKINSSALQTASVYILRFIILQNDVSCHCCDDLTWFPHALDMFSVTCLHDDVTGQLITWHNSCDVLVLAPSTRWRECPFMQRVERFEIGNKKWNWHWHRKLTIKSDNKGIN